MLLMTVAPFWGAGLGDGGDEARVEVLEAPPPQETIPVAVKRADVNASAARNQHDKIGLLTKGGLDFEALNLIRA